MMSKGVVATLRVCLALRSLIVGHLDSCSLAFGWMDHSCYATLLYRGRALIRCSKHCAMSSPLLPRCCSSFRLCHPLDRLGVLDSTQNTLLSKVTVEITCHTRHIRSIFLTAGCTVRHLGF